MLVSSRAFIISSHNNKKVSSSELLPGDYGCIHVNAHDGITLGPKNDEKQAQKTNNFFFMRRNYKRTRGHKHSVY